MKKTAILLFFQCCFLSSQAQIIFKTIAPQRPIVVGESFQVQYAISNAEKISNFDASPSFESFRFVSGPDIYSGKAAGANGIKPIKNYVFTLEAIRPGHFIIHGAWATVDGKATVSNPVIVEVISKEESESRYTPADNSAYLLRPGEDPHEKIRQNLFLKVMVNKKDCYAGEPVLATFKLYSRLQSKSDIIKNPGFYGFTVYDMVNLYDKQMTRENIKGKIFDVHTIRKIQLFPLQPGIFGIDAMEVKNKVEFSRSIVSKKTEQEIVEGVLNINEDNPPEAGGEVFETMITTEPVLIKVKPLPVVQKPASFNGAVGVFTISVKMQKNIITKNEESFFDVVISGQGNFTQLNAPFINWPEGVEAFDPVIKDSLDKTKFPLTGIRTYHYAFTCSKPGRYLLPEVSFSFFNLRINHYDSVSSAPVRIEVNAEEKTKTVIAEKKISIAEKNASTSRAAVIIILSLLAVVLIYWIRYKKQAETFSQDVGPSLQLVNEILASAYASLAATGKEFHTSLHRCIWDFLTTRFNLSGSDINKKNLADKLITGRIKETTVAKIISVLEHCEAAMFTTADIQEDREETLQQAKELLEETESQLL